MREYFRTHWIVTAFAVASGPWDNQWLARGGIVVFAVGWLFILYRLAGAWPLGDIKEDLPSVWDVLRTPWKQWQRPRRRLEENDGSRGKTGSE